MIMKAWENICSNRMPNSRVMRMWRRQWNKKINRHIKIKAQEEHVEARPVAKAITRPLTPTIEQFEKHYLEGHANFLAGCDYCVRCQGRADKHFKSDKDSKENQKGEDGVPMVSMDFCFLAQKTQDKSTPALVIKEHRTKYMGA